MTELELGFWFVGVVELLVACQPLVGFICIIKKGLELTTLCGSEAGIAEQQLQ